MEQGRVAIAAKKSWLILAIERRSEAPILSGTPRPNNVTIGGVFWLLRISNGFVPVEQGRVAIAAKKSWLILAIERRSEAPILSGTPHRTDNNVPQFLFLFPIKTRLEIHF
ncbi:MAG: hypothetical protein GY759_03215 [Chloroflexi bacterium]|nr:hypothetical protein [Chloroflexota bacterium]